MAPISRSASQPFAAWTDVTATRTFGTTYTNNSTTTRAVAISIDPGSAAGATWTLLVGTADPPTLTAGQSLSAAVAAKDQLSAIVPPGGTYRLNRSAAAGSILFWLENN